MKKILIILIILSILLVALFVVKGVAANFTLDIMNIDETGVNNRIKFAYPGIEYKVVICAVGGLYPFTWELLQAPTGMVIDSSTGEITWSSPTTGGTVEVRVTDSESSTDTESFTVSVTSSTDRFLFVDITNGSSSGTGAIGDPYQILDDFWLSDHTGKIVYYRAGTYLYPKNGAVSARHTNRIRIETDNPISHIGYPGETVVMDGESDGVSTGSYCWIVWAGADDVYFQNITFDNNWYYSIVWGADNNTVYDCTFQGINTDTGSSNQGYINSEDGVSIDYNVVFGNTFVSDLASGSKMSGMELYINTYTVIQNNTIGNTGNNGIITKQNWSNTSIRNNVFTGGTAFGGVEIYGYGTHDIEVCFNYFNNDKISVITQDYGREDGPVRDIHFYRNTFNIGIPVMYSETGFDNFKSGYITMSDNVIQNEEADSGTTPGDFSRDHIAYDNLSALEWTNLQAGIIDNLLGNDSDNIINSSGSLLEPYRTTYLGLKGWETTDTTNPSLTCQSNDTTTNTSYPFTATYTLEGARTVASCTWSNSLGGTGSCTATGGNITGTATGLSVGDNVITLSLTDSEAEIGICNFTVARTAITSTSLSGCDLSGVEM